MKTREQLAEESATKRGYMSAPARFNFMKLYLDIFKECEAACLEELSKAGDFKKRWIQYEDKQFLETVYTFDPTESKPDDDRLVDPELDDRPLNVFVELRALAAANARITALEQRNGELERELEKFCTLSNGLSMLFRAPAEACYNRAYAVEYAEKLYAHQCEVENLKGSNG